ncbi:MAG: hypothetical protein QM791_02020 [Ferruginibacter sp.]
MKTAVTIISLFFIQTVAFAQSQLACARTGLQSVNVYDSSKTRIIGTINKETYFYYDTIIGNWFSVSSYGGFCNKNEVQVFAALTGKQQKQKITAVIKKFLTICQQGNMPFTDSSKGIYDTVYIPKWQSYFDATFEPILNEFFGYYNTTKDTVTLLDFLKIGSCSPDGAFGMSFDYITGHCYDINKTLFARQVRSIKNREQRNQAKRTLLNSGITVYYNVKFQRQNKAAAEIAGLVNREQQLAKKLLQ